MEEVKRTEAAVVVRLSFQDVGCLADREL